MAKALKKNQIEAEHLCHAAFVADATVFQQLEGNFGLSPIDSRALIGKLREELTATNKKIPSKKRSAAVAFAESKIPAAVTKQFQTWLIQHEHTAGVASFPLGKNPSLIQPHFAYLRDNSQEVARRFGWEDKTSAQDRASCNVKFFVPAPM